MSFNGISCPAHPLKPLLCIASYLWSIHNYSTTALANPFLCVNQKEVASSLLLSSTKRECYSIVRLSCAYSPVLRHVLSHSITSPQEPDRTKRITETKKNEEEKTSFMKVLIFENMHIAIKHRIKYEIKYGKMWWINLWTMFLCWWVWKTTTASWCETHTRNKNFVNTQHRVTICQSELEQNYATLRWACLLQGSQGLPG